MPIHVNFVISKDLKSRIFHDIFQRYIAYHPDRLVVSVSEKPLPNADIYHYHRPHLEIELASPAVVTVHHDPRDIDPWLDPAKFWRTYRQADRVICLNSLQVQDLACVDIHNTVVIPHGYDSSIFAKKQKTFDPSRKLNIGIVSKRYDRRFKGDVYIQELAERVSPDRVRFTFVGAGRSADAAKMRKLGFEVDVHEFLPYRLFGSLYDELDFLLMVSTYEGGPANLPEALASSTPILCTKCGMVPDLVLNGENGIILSGNIREDWKLIEPIFTNDNGSCENLFVGAHRLETAISWEEVIEMHIATYEKIIADKKSKVSATDEYRSIKGYT